MRRLERLEERVAALESAPPPAQPVGTGALWALDALKARVTDPGTVLYTGSVTLPGHRQCDWQQGFEVEQLLAGDWGMAADLAGIEGLGTSGQLYHHLRQLVAAGWLRSPGRGRYEVPAGLVVALLVVVAAGMS